MSDMLKRIGGLLAVMGMSTAVLPAENGPTQAPGFSPAAPRLALLDVAGVYAVRQDKPFDPRIYDLEIAGVSLRTYWQNIEPERGRFNWALFDNAIAQAAAKGKKVRLSIMLGSGVPHWLGARWFKGSADSEYDTASQPLPVPWDENLRREQGQLIQTFAERYRNNPHVAFFHISGPSSIWEELALPKNVVEQLGWSQPQLWECWKEVIDQWQECRGNKRLSVAASAATSVYRKLGEDIGKYAVGHPADPNDTGVVGPDFCLQWNYLDTLYAKAVFNCSKTWQEKALIAWQM